MFIIFDDHYLLLKPGNFLLNGVGFGYILCVFGMAFQILYSQLRKIIPKRA